MLLELNSNHSGFKRYRQDLKKKKHFIAIIINLLICYVILFPQLRRNMLYILNSTRTISAIDDIQQVAYVLRLLTVSRILIG